MNALCQLSLGRFRSVARMVLIEYYLGMIGKSSFTSMSMYVCFVVNIAHTFHELGLTSIQNNTNTTTENLPSLTVGCGRFMLNSSEAFFSRSICNPYMKIEQRSIHLRR